MEILIGTKNKFKREKLIWIIRSYFSPLAKESLSEVEEHGKNFLEIAQNKAITYSRMYDCMAISTDGGAVIPSLSESEWEPIKTKRFGTTDEQRIAKLLDTMRTKDDRTVQWFEALAIADKGELLFSAE
ncbi:MAG: non-canonical purine NTP pyrophosphatase [Candidatus Sungbacteria bacterium]|nr:non-canonical purine NTP pyrophosphatase [Candidatus Sungbacteria bacterium]